MCPGRETDEGAERHLSKITREAEALAREKVATARSGKVTAPTPSGGQRLGEIEGYDDGAGGLLPAWMNARNLRVLSLLGGAWAAATFAQWLANFLF